MKDSHLKLTIVKKKKKKTGVYNGLRVKDLVIVYWYIFRGLVVKGIT